MPGDTAGYGERLTPPAEPIRSGYTFGGWYKEASCENLWNFETDTVAGEMTLYAKWIKKESPYVPSTSSSAPTVTASLKPGKVARNSVLTLTVTKGRKLHYTTDGSVPTENSPVYEGPIPITGDVTIKVAAFKNGTAGKIMTYTFETRPAEFHWQEDAAERSFISGYSDGTFRPDAAISRYEALEALSHLLEIERGELECPLGDVDQSHRDLVAAFVSTGIISGNDHGAFLGEKGMSRAEFAKILCLSLGLETGDSNGEFSDLNGHWAAAYLNALAEKGYLKGYPDGSMRPDGIITRAEMTALINRIIGRQTQAGDGADFSDVTQAHWAYSDIRSSAF